MTSIVSCPGCQKRLKLGTDKPGGKLRCPACNTPFVLGSRTNLGSTGTAEFLAFELFEEHVEVDSFEIVEEKPVKAKVTAPPALKSTPVQPKAEVKSASKPVQNPAPTPKPAAKKVDNLLPDDLDLLGDSPPKEAKAPLAPKQAAIALEPKPTPPSALAEEQPTSILPDDFTGLADESPAPQEAKPKLAVESKARVESKNEVRPRIEAKPAPKLAPRPEPKPAAKPPQPKDDDFFLPANFDLGAFAAPQPKPDPIPNLTLDDERSDPKPVVDDFEIIDTTPRVAADGVPLIEGASDEEIAEIEQAEQEFEQEREEQEVRARNRAERRQKRMIRRTAAQAINTEVRGRWTMVFWGITFEVAAVFCFGASLALVILSLAVALLAAVVKSGPLFTLGVILWFVIFGLMALSNILDMIGRALSIPCPAKNNAMIWAILSAMCGIAGIIGLLPITFVGLIFYLVFLKFAAEALKEYSLAEECVTLIKLVIVTFISSIFLFVFIGFAWALGVSTVAATRDGQDASNLAYVMSALGLIFIIVEVILSAVVAYKFFEILQDFRHEIRWRLES